MFTVGLRALSSIWFACILVAEAELQHGDRLRADMLSGNGGPWAAAAADMRGRWAAAAEVSLPSRLAGNRGRRAQEYPEPSRSTGPPGKGRGSQLHKKRHSSSTTKDVKEFQRRSRALERSILEDNLKHMSQDALKLECKHLEASRQRMKAAGEQSWMGQQGARISRICKALEQGNTELAARVARAKFQQAARTAALFKKDMQTNTAAKSLALGCTTLLKAKDNGSTEWFESQLWYKKAMQMCTSLSGKKDEQLQESVPTLALEETCKKVAAVPVADQVQGKLFFKKAQRMCATIQGMSQEELRGLWHRQKAHAETASGQLIRQTCKSFMVETKGPDNNVDTPWHEALSSMCSKFGERQAVKSAALARRCAWYWKLQENLDDQAYATYRKQGWFKHLGTTCTFIKNRKPGDILV